MTPSTIYPSTSYHRTDAECFVDPDTNICIGCSVWHDTPCSYCGARAFHLPSRPATLTVCEEEEMQKKTPQELEDASEFLHNTITTIICALVVIGFWAIGKSLWVLWQFLRGWIG